MGPSVTGAASEFGDSSEVEAWGSPPADGLDALREAALRACLTEFPHVRLTVSGDCMAPALRPGQVVFLARPSCPARTGAIVLVRPPAGLRLHRVVWGPPFAGMLGRMRTKGDRSLAFDSPPEPKDVLAVVIGVEGGGPVRGTYWRTRTLCSLIGGLSAAVRARLPRFFKTSPAPGGTQA